MTFSTAALTLPTPPTPPARSALPLFAAVVPVIGGVVMWLVTGSLLALCFAALGPLIAVAALLDGLRGSRRHRRRAERERSVAFDVLAAEIALRREQTTRRLAAAHPSVLGLLRDDGVLWRGADELTVGPGARPSGIAVGGSPGDDERALALVREAAHLAAAPITAPWRGGVCVVGEGVEVVAVLRALLVQLCLRFAPTQLRIVGDLPAGWEWVTRLPHRSATGAEALRVALRTAHAVDADADVVFACAGTGEPVDPRCAVVIELGAGESALVRPAAGGEVLGVDRPEAIARAQAEGIADALTAHAHALYALPAPGAAVTTTDLWAAQDAGARGALTAAFGVSGGVPLTVDLVADGPHAVVIGVTGSGKSELLSSWVTALCAAYPTTAVSFLLADFKGGTAFEQLRDLPHVSGIITDLDDGQAVRAISSLRAELRRREAALAAAGVRDIADATTLERLVIVVDEYAALVSEHAELAHVFADIAARGRALGMHLILGTQRATGIIRDSVLGNCPLRIALRVTDASDSRLVLGSDEAARLSGAAEERGHALVRRAGDVQPHRVRVVRTDAAAVAEVARRRGGEPAPRRPWQPPLPDRVTVDDLRGQRERAGIVLGLVDEPDRQDRSPWTFRPGHDRDLLVIGGAGTGRSVLLRTAAAQHDDVCWIPADPEAAWDLLAGIDAAGAPNLVLADDLDAVMGAWPDEYAIAVVWRLEALLRDPAVSLIASVRRTTGALARITDLFTHRAVLAHPTRAEFAAAGGDGAAFTARTPPGRAFVAGRWVQIAVGDGPAAPGAADPAPPATTWAPDVDAAIVHRRAAAVTSALGRGEASVVDVATLPPHLRAWADVRDLLGAGAHTPLVVVGDPESWQQRWSLLMQARAQHEVVVDASCPGELRMITGDRELPPYTLPRAQRAWRVAGAAAPQRVLLPVEDGRP